MGRTRPALREIAGGAHALQTIAVRPEAARTSGPEAAATARSIRARSSAVAAGARSTAIAARTAATAAITVTAGTISAGASALRTEASCAPAEDIRVAIVVILEHIVVALQQLLIAELIRDLIDELRRLHPLIRTVQHTTPRRGHHQLLLGTGDADVAETTLLLEILRISDGREAREESVVHPDEVHLRELKSLRTMQRHQRQKVLSLVLPIDVRHQRHILQELTELRRVALCLIVRRLTDDLLDVLEAGLGFDRSFRPDLHTVTGIIPH